MRLGDFLSAPRPAWDWVNHDCCRWVDRWVVARGCRSPIEALGLVYDSERSALRRIVEGGGLATLWADGMAYVGVPESDGSAPGDVGILELPTDDGFDEAMGIRAGQRWISLGLRGIVASDVAPVRAWRP